MSGIFEIGAQTWRVSDVKLFTNDGAGGIGTLVDVPAVALFRLTGVVSTTKYMGDGRTVAVGTILDEAEIMIQHMTANMAALKIFTGRSDASSGTTPNRKRSIKMGAGEYFPYWGVVASSKDLNSTSGVMIAVPFNKVASNFSFEFNNDGFTAPEITATAIGDPFYTTGGTPDLPLLYEMKAYETLPAIAYPLPL